MKGRVLLFKPPILQGCRSFHLRGQRRNLRHQGSVLAISTSLPRSFQPPKAVAGDAFAGSYTCDARSIAFTPKIKFEGFLGAAAAILAPKAVRSCKGHGIRCVNRPFFLL
jgi:hypothetical protein